MNTNTNNTKSISLEKYGIVDVSEIIYNPSYEFLYEEELNPALEGFERGQLSELGAVNVSKDSNAENENKQSEPEPEPKQMPKKDLLDSRYKNIHKSSGHTLARLKFKQVKNSFRFPRAKK